MQVCQPNGEVIITNDGATILKQMQLTQPAAKMLVELSKSQVCFPASRRTHNAIPCEVHPRFESASSAHALSPGFKASLFQGEISSLVKMPRLTANCKQDVVAGDGTTSVTVICGALLKKCLELLERGIHATVVSDAFAKAAKKGIEVSLPNNMLTRLSAPRIKLQRPNVTSVAFCRSCRTWHHPWTWTTEKL